MTLSCRPSRLSRDLKEAGEPAVAGTAALSSMAKTDSRQCQDMVAKDTEVLWVRREIPFSDFELTGDFVADQ
jgi:hypothetical protein